MTFSDITPEHLTRFIKFLGHERFCIKSVKTGEKGAQEEHFDLINANKAVDYIEMRNGKRQLWINVQRLKRNPAKFHTHLDIGAYINIFIDIDSKKPDDRKDFAATDTERSFALAQLPRVQAWLDGQGFGRGLAFKSGNGAGLLLPIPSTPPTPEFIAKVAMFLKTVKREAEVDVDTTTFDPPRVCGILQTWNSKLEDEAEGRRNHLRQAIGDIPTRDEDVALLRFIEGLTPDPDALKTWAEKYNHPPTDEDREENPHEEIDSDFVREKLDTLLEADPILRSLIDWTDEAKEKFSENRSDAEFGLVGKLARAGFTDPQIGWIMTQVSKIGKWTEAGEHYQKVTLKKIRQREAEEAAERCRGIGAAAGPTFTKEDFGYYVKEEYRFSPTRAINSILERMDLCVTGFTRQDRDIYRFDGEIYRPDADSLIAVILRRTCGDYAQTRQINEVTNGVLAELKRRPVALVPNPFLMPLQNGVVDLRTGKIRLYGPEDHFTFKYNASYDREGGNWRLVLWQLCSTLPGPRDVLQAIDIATSVVLRVPFDVWVLLFGGGANGKGNFEDMLAALVGAERTSGMTLDELKASRFGPGALLDVDLLIISEIEGVKGATNAMKKLATGEFLDSDVKFGGRKKGRPHLLTLLDANKAFDYGDDSFGRRRRTIKLDFPFQFGDGPDERPKDPLMKEKITSPEALNGLAHIIMARAPSIIKTRRIYQYKSSEQVEAEFNRQRFSLSHFVSECIGKVDYHIDQRREAGFDRLRLDDAHKEYMEYCRRFNIPAPAAPPQLGTYISETFNVSSSSSSEKVPNEKTGKKEKRSFRYYEGLRIIRTAEEAYADHILRFSPSTTDTTAIPQHLDSIINISEWCTTDTTDTTAIQLEEIIEEICGMYDFIKFCKSPREISWENYVENAVVPVVPVVHQQSISISHLGSCGTSRGTEEECRGIPPDDPADEPEISDDERQTIAEELKKADQREAGYLNHVKTPEPKAHPSEEEIARALEIAEGLNIQGRRVTFGNVEDYLEKLLGEYVEPKVVWRVLKTLEFLGWGTGKDGALSEGVVA